MLGNYYVIERFVVHDRRRAMAGFLIGSLWCCCDKCLNDAMRSDSIAL